MAPFNWCTVDANTCKQAGRWESTEMLWMDFLNMEQGPYMKRCFVLDVILAVSAILFWPCNHMLTVLNCAQYHPCKHMSICCPLFQHHNALFLVQLFKVQGCCCFLFTVSNQLHLSLHLSFQYLVMSSNSFLSFLFFLPLCCICTGQPGPAVQFTVQLQTLSSTPNPLSGQILGPLVIVCACVWRACVRGCACVCVCVCVSQREKECVIVSLVQQTSSKDISNGFHICCVRSNYDAVESHLAGLKLISDKICSCCVLLF